MDKQYNDFHINSVIQNKPIKKINFVYRLIINEIEDVLNGQNKDNTKILDYGCGVGTVDLYLASIGNRVVGIDISPKAIALASLSTLKIGLSKQVTFVALNEWRKIRHKEKFDLVLCSEVIEHVSDDKKVLNEIAKSLSKNGELVLSTPSINAPLHKLGLARNFDKRVGHLRRYDLKELTSKITSSGFKIKKVIKTEGIIRNSLFLLPHLGWIIKFLKGPLSDLVTYLDNMTIPLFGESNFIVIAQKT